MTKIYNALDNVFGYMVEFLDRPSTMFTGMAILAVVVLWFAATSCSSDSTYVPVRERRGHIVCSDPSGRIMADEDTIGADDYASGKVWYWKRADGTEMKVSGHCTLTTNPHSRQSPSVEAPR